MSFVAFIRILESVILSPDRVERTVNSVDSRATYQRFLKGLEMNKENQTPPS